MNEAVIDEPRVIVALDFSDGDRARRFVDRLEPGSCRLKIGKELFTREGPELVRRFTAGGHKVFLDLKFHDIPTTVARACQAAAAMNVWMLNVHASGGSKMMCAARSALDELGPQRPLLIGVTVLTSMAREDLTELGVSADPAEQVLKLAKLAKSSGLDGVVCSAQEATLLRSELGDNFKLVTPGIRPKGAPSNDQRRVVTPADAIRGGSDYLVMGRPITSAVDPVSALKQINGEVKAALLDQLS